MGATSEESIADIREAVRPEQDLDQTKASKRLELTRKKSPDEAEDLVLEQNSERDDPGTGDAVFEDVAADRGDAPDTRFAGWFDPSTMARVRVRVEVRR